jgi:hypothetical protein
VDGPVDGTSFISYAISATNVVARMPDQHKSAKITCGDSIKVQVSNGTTAPTLRFA